MSTPVFFSTLGLFFGTVLLVFAMKYFSAVMAARAKIASEANYRELAEKAAALQAETQAALAAIQGEITRTAASLASIERVLKQVE